MHGELLVELAATISHVPYEKLGVILGGKSPQDGGR